MTSTKMTEAQMIAFIVEETGALNTDMVRLAIAEANGNLNHAAQAVKAEQNRMAADVY